MALRLAPDSPEALCARLATAQHGMLRRQQALEAGFSASAIARRTSSGIWQQPILPGVYRLPGATEGPLQKLAAACLWLPDAVASHRSAAALLGLLAPEVDITEVSLARRVRAPDWLVIHRANEIPFRHVIMVDGIPTTDAGLTLLHLGAVADAEVVEDALQTALNRRLVSLSHMAGVLTRFGGRGRRGAATLRSVLGERMGSDRPVESVLERRVLSLIRRAGLPEPRCQYEIRPSGRFIARVDFAFPDSMLAVEAMGMEFHTAPRAVKGDLARHNALTRAGWTLLYVTWEDVTRRSVEVVASIRDRLR